MGKGMAINSRIWLASPVLALFIAFVMWSSICKAKTTLLEPLEVPQTALESGRGPESGQFKKLAEMVQNAYRNENYRAAIEWGQRFFSEGGTDSTVRSILSRSYYAVSDFENAARSLHLEYEQSEKAAKIPSEDVLRLLARCYVHVNDISGQSWAMERLVTYYPRKEHWVELISLIQRQVDFGPDLALDVWRLRLATGTIGGADDYQKAVNLALQSGFLAEAKRMIDKGFADGSLGTGIDADQHKKLRDLVNKQLAREKTRLAAGELPTAAAPKSNGNALVNAGLSLVTMDEPERGMALIKQGLAQPKPSRPQYDRLHQGIAALLVGRKAEAIALFKTISGRHGAADLGRLWYIFALQQINPVISSSNRS